MGTYHQRRDPSGPWETLRVLAFRFRYVFLQESLCRRDPLLSDHILCQILHLVFLLADIQLLGVNKTTNLRTRWDRGHVDHRSREFSMSGPKI